MTNIKTVVVWWGLGAVAGLGLVDEVVGQVSAPGPRYGHGMAYDATRDRVMLFGGNSNAAWPSGALNDTWEWSGSSWTQRFPTASPTARGHGSMAFDPIRQKCVYFGGYLSGNSGINETWEWDGANWQQKFPQVSPGPRWHQAMVWASHIGRIVMFGGFNAGGGLGDTWTWDGLNWQQVATSISPSPRWAHAMAYDNARAEVLIFGGYLNGAALGDTWSFDGSSWSQKFPQRSPGARFHHAMSFVSIASSVVMFGGLRNWATLGDGWMWNGSDWAPINSSLMPSPRHYIEGAFVYDEGRQQAFMFGGWSGQALGEAWVFNGAQWAPALSYLTSPANGNRYAVTPPMTWLQAEALAVQEGGHLATIRSAAENAWALQSFGSNLWIGLNDVATEGVYVWSSGESAAYRNWAPGEPENDPSQDGVHFWSQYPGQWGDRQTYVATPGLIELPGGPTAPLTATSLPTSATPVPLTSHALAPLPSSGALLFGGTTTTLPQPFTFTLTNTAWSKEFSLLNPMARADHTLLLDPARANNLLFGGRNALGAALNDTWTFAGGQWSYLPLATAPSPRSGHRMAFDPTTNTGLLFGGVDAQNQPLGDFWSWNGTAWTQLAPATLPPARGHHGLAWDARRSRLVLFGGQAGATRLQDTWEWDGTAWTQWTPTPPPASLPLWAPSARRGHGMAYDPRSERVVVVGGESANGCEGDVWSWDGAGWTRHVTAGPLPSARTGLQLYHDAGANELRLFGGGCGTSYTNDLWSLQLPVYARSTTYGAGCAGSLATPGLALLPPSAPIVGTTMNLEITGVPGSFIPALGALGYSRTSWLGLPLPLDLAPAGLPGCPLLQSAEVVSAVAPPNGTGVVTWPVAIPNNPLLLGGEVFFQALAIEVPGFPRWASLSNGLAVRLGDR